MVYSKKQLLEIIATKRAIPGRFYDQDNGDVFVGVENGTLVQWQRSDQNVFNSKDLSAKTTNKAIEEVKSDSDKGVARLNNDFSKSFLLMGG